MVRIDIPQRQGLGAKAEAAQYFDAEPSSAMRQVMSSQVESCQIMPRQVTASQVNALTRFLEAVGVLGHP